MKNVSVLCYGRLKIGSSTLYKDIISRTFIRQYMGN